MLSLIGTLGSAIVGGVSNYFQNKQELKKVKVEAEKKVILAKAEAQIALAKSGQQQEYDLDRIAMEDMKKSWKDEAVMLIYYTPLVLVFIPSMAPYIEEGFKVLDKLPEWYMYLVVGITVVIMGMRGMLTKFLGLISNRLSFKGK